MNPLQLEIVIVKISFSFIASREYYSPLYISKTVPEKYRQPGEQPIASEA